MSDWNQAHIFIQTHKTTEANFTWRPGHWTPIFTSPRTKFTWPGKIDLFFFYSPDPPLTIYMYQQVTIAFSFTDWLKKWLEFLRPITLQRNANQSTCEIFWQSRENGSKYKNTNKCWLVIIPYISAVMYSILFKTVCFASSKSCLTKTGPMSL